MAIAIYLILPSQKLGNGVWCMQRGGMSNGKKQRYSNVVISHLKGQQMLHSTLRLNLVRVSKADFPDKDYV